MNHKRHCIMRIIYLFSRQQLWIWTNLWTIFIEAVLPLDTSSHWNCSFFSAEHWGFPPWPRTTGNIKHHWTLKVATLASEMKLPSNKLNKYQHKQNISGAQIWFHDVSCYFESGPCWGRFLTEPDWQCQGVQRTSRLRWNRKVTSQRMQGSSCTNIYRWCLVSQHSHYTADKGEVSN